MKLVFKKNEDHQISVFHDVVGNQRDFSYVDMIKALIKSSERNLSMKMRHLHAEFSLALDHSEAARVY